MSLITVYITGIKYGEFQTLYLFAYTSLLLVNLLNLSRLLYFYLEMVVEDGLLRTRMMLSPLRNILPMNLSLGTDFPSFPTSVHISLTPSNTMLRYPSNAFTRPINYFLRLMRTLFWFSFLCSQPSLVTSWIGLKTPL